MAWSRKHGGAEKNVVTALYSLILLTSLFRSIWFLVPNTVLQPTFPSAKEFGIAVQSKHKNKKPLLVIHAGPAKTGTSYIQSILPSPSSREILAQDNYLYLGRCYSEVTYKGQDPHCLNEQHTAIGGDFFYLNGKEQELLPDFKILLERVKDEKKNGLVSFEGSILEIKRLMPLIRDDFDVRATFAYRRMYDQTASMYAQSLKLLDRTQLFCGTVPPPTFEFLAFPTIGELESIGIFEPNCQNFWLNEWDSLHKTIHPLKAQIRKFTDAGVVTPIPIMNMYTTHEDSIGNDILVEFFCVGGVPGSTNSCKAAKEDKFVGKRRDNVRFEVDFLRLIYKAKDLKLVNGKIDRKLHRDFSSAMNTAILAYDRSLPKTCMSSDKLEKLYEWSWELDNALGIDERAPHRAAFVEQVQKGKFCSYDADKIIEDEEWQKKIQSFGL